MRPTLALLHHANLSHLRALGFKTVMRNGQHAAILRRDGIEVFSVLMPTRERNAMVAAMTRDQQGTIVGQTYLWDVHPLCLSAAVLDVLDGRETNRFHRHDCTCPNSTD